MRVTENNIYAASEAMGETTEMLRLCQRKGADGCNANGSINTKKLRAWIDANRQALESELPDSLEYHKKVSVVKKNHLLELERKEKERTLLDPDEVKQLLTVIATSQSAVLKRLMAEVPPKCAGKTEPEIKVITDKVINEFFKVIQGKLDTWK